MDKDNKDTSDFVREQIVNKPSKWKRRLQKIGRFVLCAVVFGLLASLTIAIATPSLVSWLGTGPTEPDSDITVPRDTEPTAAAMPSSEDNTEDVSLSGDATQPPESDEEEETTAEPEESVMESSDSNDDMVYGIVQDILETMELGEEDYLSLLSIENTMIQRAKRGIVTVSVVRNMEDENGQVTQTNAAFSAGAIWEVTQSEILILVENSILSNLEDTSSIYVTFNTGSGYTASLKQADYVTGIGILAVSISEVDEVTQGSMETITLGSSYLVKSGDRVFAVGNPDGNPGSVTKGDLSSIKTSNPGVDSDFRMLYADITVLETGSGFLMNIKGEIIGVIKQGSEYRNGDIIQAIAISDLKGIIQKLANGERVAYLGITGEDVTSTQNEENGTPLGVCVKNININEPAYRSLAPEDVITKVGEHTVTTMRELQQALEYYDPGKTIQVEVERLKEEGYVSLTFDIVLGER